MDQKLIQLGLKMILDGKLLYFMKLRYSKRVYTTIYVCEAASGKSLSQL